MIVSHGMYAPSGFAKCPIRSDEALAIPPYTGPQTIAGKAVNTPARLTRSPSAPSSGMRNESSSFATTASAINTAEKVMRRKSSALCALRSAGFSALRPPGRGTCSISAIPQPMQPPHSPPHDGISASADALLKAAPPSPTVSSALPGVLPSVGASYADTPSEAVPPSVSDAVCAPPS